MTKCINCGEEIEGPDGEMSFFPDTQWKWHTVSDKFACYWPEKHYKDNGRQMFAEA